MALNGAVLLMAYSCIKPVREALILAHPGGAEYKSWLGAAIAVLLLRSRLPRFVVWGFIALYVVGFIAYFPFRVIPD